MVGIGKRLENFMDNLAYKVVSNKYDKIIRVTARKAYTRDVASGGELNPNCSGSTDSLSQRFKDHIYPYLELCIPPIFLERADGELTKPLQSVPTMRGY
ncbi:MAG: hypothetical protein AABW91_03305 [Nanoarchaeota archaeon]